MGDCEKHLPKSLWKNILRKGELAEHEATLANSWRLCRHLHTCMCDTTIIF